MADLFGSVPAPRLSFTPAQADTMQLANAWEGGARIGLAQRQQSFAEQQYNQKRQDTLQAADELGQMARDYGVRDEASFNDFLAKNPGLMMDPHKGPLVELALQGLAQMNQAKSAVLDVKLKGIKLADELESKSVISDYQSRFKTATDWMNAPLPDNPVARSYVLDQKKNSANTISGEMVTQDVINFSKSLATIDKEDRQMIREMTPNEDGTPTSQQMKVLSIAEEKIRARTQAIAQERALFSPSVLAELQRAGVQLKIAADRDTTALQVAKMKADASIQNHLVKGFDWLDRAPLQAYESDLKSALQIGKLTDRTAELARVNAHWAPIMEAARQAKVAKGQTTPDTPASPAGLPAVGEVRKGYRFKGGDPANKDSWEPAP